MTAAAPSCAPILGASAATYLLLPADVGATLRVAVTATNGSGPATATSDPTALVAAQPNLPANTTPPAITGTAREGQTLSAGTGVWTGSPTSYGYAWQRCDSTGGACTPIAGAAAATYVLVAADAGGTVRVAVTATNGAGSASATSAATAAVLPLAPANSNLPVVSGTAQQGQTLAATTGAWTGSPTGFAYAWQRCDAAGGGCTPILGATATTYLLLPADVGATLRVAVTATNAGGSATATSAATAVVAGAVLDGTFGQTQIGTSRDSGGPGWLDVSGPYAVGQAVTVTRLNAYLSGGGGTANVRGLIYRDSGGQPGALVAATPPTTVAANAAAAWVSMPLSAPVALDAGSYWLGYWYADGNASFAYVTVSGSERYTPTPYSATASPPSSFPAASTSFSSYSLYATYTVTATLPVNTTPPAVTGGTVVGQTLSADNGAWTGSPTSFAYEWRRCDTAGSNCTAIAGATAATYVLAAADTGHTLRVAVTATNASGSAAASSDPTAVVTATAPPPPTNTALPAITGTAESGQTLAATQGSWSGSPTSYAYEWRRCDTGGASCTAILGATAASYQLTPSDVDATLRVAVTATNAGGDATAVSAATATVTAPVAGPIAFIRHNVPLGAYDQVTEGNNAGDMDGDGRPDVVVAGDQYVVWYHSTDWAPHVIASGDRFGAGAMVLIEDVNGDGRQDVITGEQANESCSGTCQTDWFENGPTGWTTHVLQTAAYCHDLAWGDLNGDGRPDLACDDQQRERIVWLEHPADPAQAWTVHVIDPQAAMGAQISDIDSDGCLDVVAGEAWYDNVNCDGSTWTRHPYTTLAGPTYPGTPNFTDFEKIVVSDINGDGRPDVAATLFSDNPQGQEWVFLAPQDPLTQSWTAVQLDAGPLFSVHSEVMADFDGSGRPQIAVGESDPGGWSFGANPGTQLNIYEATGNPADASGWQKTTIDVIAAHEMRTADLDGDGHPDLVGDFENTDLLNPPRTGAIHWWENNTDGSAVAPSNPGAPSVVGTAAQGQTLTGWDDGWTGSTPIATAYQWLSCDTAGASCTPIAGATATTYLVSSADAGHTLRLRVTATNTAGSSAITSAATAVVGGGGGGTAPANTALPAIAGSAVQGQTLNATTGTWTGSPTGYAYEWQRCDSGGANCTPILGATGPSYLLAAGDVDSTIRVAVTATNDTGSATAVSDPTGTVTALPGAPANTALPAIAGSAVQGQTLNATTGTWTGSPTAYAYEWQRCDSGGANCTPILGATAASYQLTPSDVDATLRVAVTATNDTGSATAVSDPTGTVTALPARTREHRAAHDLRRRDDGRDAVRDHRHLDRLPDRLRLRVAALRQRRRKLHADIRRDRPELSARRRRRRLDDPGRRHRDERHGQRHRRLRADGHDRRPVRRRQPRPVDRRHAGRQRRRRLPRRLGAVHPRLGGHRHEPRLLPRRRQLQLPRTRRHLRRQRRTAGCARRRHAGGRDRRGRGRRLDEPRLLRPGLARGRQLLARLLVRRRQRRPLLRRGDRRRALPRRGLLRDRRPARHLRRRLVRLVELLADRDVHDALSGPGAVLLERLERRAELGERGGELAPGGRLDRRVVVLRRGAGVVEVAAPGSAGGGGDLLLRRGGEERLGHIPVVSARRAARVVAGTDPAYENEASRSRSGRSRGRDHLGRGAAARRLRVRPDPAAAHRAAVGRHADDDPVAARLAPELEPAADV